MGLYKKIKQYIEQKNTRYVVCLTAALLLISLMFSPALLAGFLLGFSIFYYLENGSK